MIKEMVIEQRFLKILKNDFKKSYWIKIKKLFKLGLKNLIE